VLLVDDLADSGQTLNKTKQYLEGYYREDIKSLRTATLWCKACSSFTPDYYVDFLAHNPWIHQPFERYENGNGAESFLRDYRQP
ncbi:MAG: phosphoribosyltransferase family protein, partial [Cyanobacteria bacterium P01_H01_bin.130]